jgi:hypothetical protein
MNRRAGCCFLSFAVRTWLAGAVALLLAGGSAMADHTSSDPAVVGELGPLIPFHKDAIHAGLEWSQESGGKARNPRICFWMRPSEYQGIHLVNPALVPGPGALKSPNSTPASGFRKYVYGRDYTPGYGFNFSTGPHGLDESVASRIVADLYLDNGLCLDLEHPHAFRNSGKYNVAELTERDFALNMNAFSNAGHSTGLDYNIFCAGQVALADGRWVFVGGHDKAGNNGIRKMTIFDPATQAWVNRGMPAVKAAYLADPEISNPAIHPDPNDEANTDPPHPSDMKHQRWYPTAVHLPDDTVLVLSGTDQDSSLPYQTASTPPCSSDLNTPPSTPACSKYRPNAPELYRPDQDTTISLENSWKVLSMYPIAYPVQTGPEKADWKVVVIGEVDHGEFGGPTCNGGKGFRGDRTDQECGIQITEYDPWPYSGKTYLYDVQAAVADPQWNTPDESGKYWSLVDTAAIAHESGASTMLVKLDDKGRPLSQKLALFGGSCGERPDGFSCDQATVEWIDFQDRSPKWTRHPKLKLSQEVSQILAMALPDGKVVLIGGSLGRGTPPGGWRNSFHYQMFDPSDGRFGSITPLVETNLPTHDHATRLLLPDASVIRMGGNRTDLAYFTGPPCNAGAQCSNQETRNAGVPVAQIYKPAYFFKGDRPIIEKAPGQISYAERFGVRVSGSIKSVAMIQQHPTTHNHMWNRYVELWFEEVHGEVTVQGPRFPGVAPPGRYLLFVVDDNGVPSVGEPVRIAE